MKERAFIFLYISIYLIYQLSLLVLHWQLQPLWYGVCTGHEHILSTSLDTQQLQHQVDCGLCRRYFKIKLKSCTTQSSLHYNEHINLINWILVFLKWPAAVWKCHGQLFQKVANNSMRFDMGLISVGTHLSSYRD